jgi:hypothetical protein
VGPGVYTTIKTIGVSRDGYAPMMPTQHELCWPSFCLTDESDMQTRKSGIEANGQLSQDTAHTTKSFDR